MATHAYIFQQESKIRDGYAGVNNLSQAYFQEQQNNKQICYPENRNTYWYAYQEMLQLRDICNAVIEQMEKEMKTVM